MTQKDVLKMAEEAGWTGIYSQWISPTEREHLTVPVTMEQIQAFAKLVAAHEREACAKVCENIYTGEEACGDWPTPEMCAEAIRVRKEQA